MNSLLLFIIFVVVLFVLIIVNNLYEKKQSTYFMIAVAIILGILFYAYGYFYVSEKNPSSILISALKSIFAIFSMVAGKSSLSDISSVPLLNNKIVLLIFYIIHLFIYTIVITALLVNFGKHLIVSMNNLYRWLFCKNNIYIFYRINEKVINVIKNIPEKDSQIVILEKDFLKNNENFDDIVMKRHSIILSDKLFKDNSKNNKSDLVLADKYLSSILLGKRFKNKNIRFYALNDNVYENYKVISELCDYLQPKDYYNKIKVTIYIDEKYNLRVLENRKVFDYIRGFDEKEIMSRVLVSNYPPSKYIEFENCKAKDGESFNCLIIGFGSLSQNILKKLFIYGHFANTQFNCKIIDKNFKDVAGKFKHEFGFLNDERIYLNKFTNITSEEIDARSEKFYDYFMSNKDSINYVVVGTGSDKSNEEIIKYLIRMRNDLNLKFDLFDCLENRIYAYEYVENNQEDLHKMKVEYKSVDYLADDRIDTAGKWINYVYNKKHDTNFDPIKEKNEIDKEWNKRDYYDKNSSINAADYYTTILKVCKYNITNFNNQVFDDKKLNELKEGFGNNKEKGSKYYNLTAIDHDRWAGYILLEQRYGYMDDTHWDKRANEYNNLSEEEKKNYRIQNDKENRLHAYLRSMDDLQKLYIKEDAVTKNDPNKRYGAFNNLDMAVLIAKYIDKC